MNEEKIIKILKINLMTANQKKAILSNNPPILVSSSAGSGKTTVLTKRYLFKILTDKNFNSNHFLALTFSNEAAKEMFNRIFNEIENFLKQQPKNQNLKKIKNSISKKNITTIDSFCFNLIKKNHKNLNISPNFKMVSQEEIFNLKNKVLNFVLEKEYLKNSENFLKLTDYFNLNSSDGLKTAILKIYNKAKVTGFFNEYLKNILKSYCFPEEFKQNELLKEIKNNILEKVKQTEILTKLAINLLKKDENSKNVLTSLKINNLNIKKLETKIKNSSYYKINNILQNFKFEAIAKYNKKTNPFNKELVELIKKTYLNPAKKIISSLFEVLKTKEENLKDLKNQKEIVKQIIFLTIKFSKKLKSTKRKKNILEFSDLITNTLKLLIKNKTNKKLTLTNLAKKLSKQFKEILVDEFQDINPAQNLLIKILSNDGKNLFLVGDLKQSIYGFRDSDSTIFLKLKKELEDNKKKGELIYLNKNFRSKKEVTGSINFLFGQLMSKNFGGVNYKKTDFLICKKNLKENENYNTELHILKNFENEEKIKLEMAHIATTIKKMITEKFIIQKNNKKRSCKPKDFAILLRSDKEALKPLCDELKKLKIDFLSFCDVNFLNSFEVSLLTSVLKLINNPFLNIPFLAVIFSNMFNFKKEEIIKLRINCYDKSFYEIFKNSKEKKCKIVIDFIENFRKKALKTTLEELIKKILNSNTFLKIFKTTSFDETKSENLNLFLKTAKKYKDYFKLGLSGFLEHLVGLKNQEFKVKTNLKLKNAVKIMTIHKSKGLEFPIVFVPLLNKKFNETDFKDHTITSFKFGLGLKHSNKNILQKYNTLPFYAAMFLEKKLQKEEELRLLYVALTRAEQKIILTATDEKKLNKIKQNQFNNLVLPACYLKNKNSFYDWVLEAFLRNKNVKLSKNIIDFEDENFNCSLILKDEFKKINFKITSKKENLKNVEKLHKTLKNNIAFFKQTKKTKKIPIKISVSKIAKNNNPLNKKLVLKNPNFKNEKTNAQKGTITHIFFQYVNFENAEKNLNLEIKRLIKNNFIFKNQLKFLNIFKIKKFFNSKAYFLIKNADFVFREKEFVCEINSNKIFKNTNNKILLQGIVDCILEKNKKLTIIDYKTDCSLESLIKKKYKTQLKFYKYAIEKIMKKPVTKLLIYSTHLEKTIKIWQR